MFIISKPSMNEKILSYSPETLHLGQNRRLFVACDLEMWRMTLKNNRAPLLSNTKLCASFHLHMWFRTGVTVRKPLNGVLTSATLTFDLWPWSFARTSLVNITCWYNSNSLCATQTTSKRMLINFVSNFIATQQNGGKKPWFSSIRQWIYQLFANLRQLDASAAMIMSNN